VGKPGPTCLPPTEPFSRPTLSISGQEMGVSSTHSRVQDLLGWAPGASGGLSLAAADRFGVQVAARCAKITPRQALLLLLLLLQGTSNVMAAKLAKRNIALVLGYQVCARSSTGAARSGLCVTDQKPLLAIFLKQPPACAPVFVHKRPSRARILTHSSRTAGYALPGTADGSGRNDYH
jgi:hypothetical protein